MEKVLETFAEEVRTCKRMNAVKVVWGTASTLKAGYKVESWKIWNPEFRRNFSGFVFFILVIFFPPNISESTPKIIRKLSDFLVQSD